jgi:hypothetical protein
VAGNGPAVRSSMSSSVVKTMKGDNKVVYLTWGCCGSKSANTTVIDTHTNTQALTRSSFFSYFYPNVQALYFMCAILSLCTFFGGCNFSYFYIGASEMIFKKRKQG